jgi:excinuclease UvrABC ATPase subunit
MQQGQIRVVGARQHNLKDVSLTVPRRAITAFTGVSGSGKTSLVFDTIAAEAQRQLNETFTAFVRNRLPRYGRPDVDMIEGLSPAVVINQRRLGGNARSTVGTITDIHALLRLLFSRAGTPEVGESNVFSFNDPAGMCPRCSGIGRVVRPAVDTFLDLDRSLEDGAILLPGFGNGQYWYRQYADIGSFDASTPLGAWSAEEREALVYGGEAAARLGRRPPKDYEGLLERFTRIYIHTEGEVSARKQAVIDRFTTSELCPDCRGERLNELARSVRVDGHTITECTAMEVSDLIPVIGGVSHPASAPVVQSLVERLEALADIGLGYLSLGRATTTLSGGESQRIKLVRHLGSSLIEMLYVFDEPSIGLHPHDVQRLTGLLRRLRDKGNTVLVVEHDPDVVAVADHVVDVGPGAGTEGGAIVFQGSVQQLADADTLTGRALHERLPLRTDPRQPTGTIAVTGADRHNLRDVDVDFPTGCSPWSRASPVRARAASSASCSSSTRAARSSTRRPWRPAADPTSPPIPASPARSVACSPAPTASAPPCSARTAPARVLSAKGSASSTPTSRSWRASPRPARCARADASPMTCCSTPWTAARSPRCSS